MPKPYPPAKPTNMTLLAGVYRRADPASRIALRSLSRLERILLVLREREVLGVVPPRYHGAKTRGV